MWFLRFVMFFFYTNCHCNEFSYFNTTLKVIYFFLLYCLLSINTVVFFIKTLTVYIRNAMFVVNIIMTSITTSFILLWFVLSTQRQKFKFYDWKKNTKLSFIVVFWVYSNIHWWSFIKFFSCLTNWFANFLRLNYTQQ